MTKKEFMEATNLDYTWNKIIKWSGYTISSVRWHNNPWKILPSSIQTTHDDFDIISERSYEPIKEFHTHQDMWLYVKANQTS